MATELHSVLEKRDDVVMRTLALRSSWKWVHIKAVPFLASLAVRLGREAVAHQADAILFTSMTTALPLLIAGPALKKQGHPVRRDRARTGRHRSESDLSVVGAASLRDARRRHAGQPRHRRAVGGARVARERVHVVPNAVDLDRFEGVAAARMEPVKLHIAGAPPLPDDAFLLVTVGRQVRRKGFAWFIEHVMPRLPDRVVFWLAGDGPERENIERAIVDQASAPRSLPWKDLRGGARRALSKRPARSSCRTSSFPATWKALAS